MIRAVYDCNVLIAAVLAPKGRTAACLNLCREGYVRLALCPAMIDETRAALNQPSLRRRNQRLTDDSVEAFLRDVSSIATIENDPPRTISLPRDPNDEVYVNLAIACSASDLVTRDNDLQALRSDQTFIENYPQLTISDPDEFLHRLRTAISIDLGYE